MEGENPKKSLLSARLSVMKRDEDYKPYDEKYPVSVYTCV